MVSKALTLAGLLDSFSVLRDWGRVNWANTSTTLIFTNNCSGALGGLTGLNTYRFGFQAGPPGTPAGSLIPRGHGFEWRRVRTH